MKILQRNHNLIPTEGTCFCLWTCFPYDRNYVKYKRSQCPSRPGRAQFVVEHVPLTDARATPNGGEVAKVARCISTKQFPIKKFRQLADNLSWAASPCGVHINEQKLMFNTNASTHPPETNSKNLPYGWPRPHPQNSQFQNVDLLRLIHHLF